MRKNRGFSLVELIIVIAIMAALVAILAPQYIRYVEKTRATVCSVNRSQLMRESYVELIGSGGGSDYPEIMRAVLELEHPVCQSGGVYTVEEDDEGRHYISCSVHGDSPKAASFGQQETMEALHAALKDVKADQLDSGAAAVSSEKIAQLTRALEAQGISLEAMGAESWHYDNTKGSGMLYWSMDKITEADVDKRIPVMKYNAGTGNYTVWYCDVEWKTASILVEGQKKAVSVTYLVLSEEKASYAPSVKDKENQTYEQALKYYQAAMEEYNQTQSPSPQPSG